MLQADYMIACSEVECSEGYWVLMHATSANVRLVLLPPNLPLSLVHLSCLYLNDSQCQKVVSAQF